LEIAYDIVASNRSEKGYPLSMGRDEMIKTAQLVPIDSFIVRYEEKPVAAAIVYRVTPRIPLVVYWGDLSEYASYRTMNYLAYQVFTHYAELGVDRLDVGTSMIDNRPNYGLCEFKESIGCSIVPRLCFSKELR
jgi:lipid II:glycine glycyltransferase (peptidoglycan interpeptide bridge formation enzyme)